MHDLLLFSVCFLVVSDFFFCFLTFLLQYPSFHLPSSYLLSTSSYLSIQVFSPCIPHPGPFSIFGSHSYTYLLPLPPLHCAKSKLSSYIYRYIPTCISKRVKALVAQARMHMRIFPFSSVYLRCCLGVSYCIFSYLFQ